jgi:hypothetical protein
VWVRRQIVADTRNDLQRVFGPIDGARIPGGCEDCDAFQKPVQIAFGVWVLQIFHDDWCPTLKRMEGRS